MRKKMSVLGAIVALAVVFALVPGASDAVVRYQNVRGISIDLLRATAPGPALKINVIGTATAVLPVRVQTNGQDIVLVRSNGSIQLGFGASIVTTTPSPTPTSTSTPTVTPTP